MDKTGKKQVEFELRMEDILEKLIYDATISAVGTFADAATTFSGIDKDIKLYDYVQYIRVAVKTILEADNIRLDSVVDWSYIKNEFANKIALAIATFERGK